MSRRAFPVIYSHDVERAARFYVEWLGFEEQLRLPPEGEAGYVALSRPGGAELAIVAADWPEEQLGVATGEGPRFELFVYVDDVDGLVGRLGGAAVAVLRQPQDMPWGERVGYVADPDGNPVALAAAAR